MTPDLFSLIYPPLGVGFKEPTTSREAAERTQHRVRVAHARILKLLATVNLTADEAAVRLDGPKAEILFWRPRFSELGAAGKIVKSGEKRKNARSRMKAHVWRLA